MSCKPVISEGHGLITEGAAEVKQTERLIPELMKKFFDFGGGGHYYRAPMLGVLPERVVPDQLLAAGGRLQGRVPLGLLDRLAGSLQVAQAQDSAASADLWLMLDPQGRYWLQGRIEAQLALRCERCQGSLEWPVETKIGLYLVASESAAAELAEDVEYVVAGDNLRVHELVEDELILALPLVPRHPQGTKCGDRVRKGPLAESGERDNPFAMLKKLKT
jgi:uncharacterized protein